MVRRQRGPGRVEAHLAERASPSTRSGCGARRRAWARPRSSSTPSTTGSRPATRSGAWSSATPAGCSTTPSRRQGHGRPRAAAGVGDRDFFRILRAWTTRRPAATASSRSSSGWPSGSRRAAGRPVPGVAVHRRQARAGGAAAAATAAARGRRPVVVGRGRAPAPLSLGLGAGARAGRFAPGGQARRLADPPGPGLGALGLDDPLQGGPAHRPGEAVPPLAGPGWPAKAAARSSGTTRSSTASSLVHDPSRLASSMQRQPGLGHQALGEQPLDPHLVRPPPLRLRANGASSAGRRGLPALPSIHPKHRASSTASS